MPISPNTTPSAVSARNQPLPLWTCWPVLDGSGASGTVAALRIGASIRVHSAKKRNHRVAPGCPARYPSARASWRGGESSQAPTCLDCGHLHQTDQRRLHNEFKVSRPRFAMVCLELVRVTGCFPRDRDRIRTYPPPKRPGLDRKSSRIPAFTARSAGLVARRAWQALIPSRIAPGGKELNIRAVRGWIRSAEPSRYVISGPNVARFLVNPIGLDWRMRTLTHPDNSRIARS